jgi:DNA-binding LacI/PurR family transcriptional regulator
MKRFNTIVEVAEKAGVSVSTASRVLRGHPDVSSQTRKKVLNASKELNYHPSRLAQSLVLGKTATIGLLVSDIDNPFYPALAKSIEKAASAHEFIVVLCNTEDDPDRSYQYLERLISQGVDGIIHASIGKDESHLSLVIEAGIPIVCINRQPRYFHDIDIIASDNLKGAEEIVTHLLSLGHTSIAHLAGPEYASLSRERLEGYRKALEKRHIQFELSQVIPCAFTRESGREGVKELFKNNAHPGAIFAINDVVALGAMDELYEMGYKIPQDVSIVGFDDIEFARFPSIQLTTCSQNFQDMGHLAFERLLDAISNPENHKPETLLLDTKVIVRKTSGPPPIAR